MKHTITLAVAAAVAVAGGAGSAAAGCAPNPANLKAAATQAGGMHAIPDYLVRPLNSNIRVPPPPPGNAGANIVGTWLVTYTLGGAPFAQAFIQWHSDGTESETINLPPVDGNVCAGSWQVVDSLHVSRNHYGWMFNGGALTNYFNEIETDKVGNNVYSGTNELIIYDLSGNVVADIPGTAHAVRIAP